MGMKDIYKKSPEEIAEMKQALAIQAIYPSIEEKQEKITQLLRTLDFLYPGITCVSIEGGVAISIPVADEEEIAKFTGPFKKEKV
jgi:hypothetical protein